MAADSTSSPPHTTRNPGAYRRLRLHTWRGRLGWVAGILGGLLVGCWVLARMTPSWYMPLDPADQRVIDLAGEAEHALLDLNNRIQRVPLGEQTWSISQDQVNSYLAIDRVFASSGGGARAVSRPYVVFSPGQMIITARMAQLPGGHPDGGVGTLIFTVRVVEGPGGERMGQVKLIGVRAGRLPVPLSVVQGRLRSLAPVLAGLVEEFIRLRLPGRDGLDWSQHTEEVLRAIGEGRPFSLEVTGGRPMRIRQMWIEDGRFTVVFAPLAREPGRRN